MRTLHALAIALVFLTAPARAQSAEETALDTALRACEAWVLFPQTWAEGIDGFADRVGTAHSISKIGSVPEFALPPPKLRRANHYWLATASENSGVFLVTSDRLPMCHITGGGTMDFQPMVESLLISDSFLQRWKPGEETNTAGMRSTTFVSREDPDFSVVVSRPSRAGQRLDRVQVIATAQYSLD